MCPSLVYLSVEEAKVRSAVRGGCRSTVKKSCKIYDGATFAMEVRVWSCVDDGTMALCFWFEQLCTAHSAISTPFTECGACRMCIAVVQCRLLQPEAKGRQPRDRAWWCCFRPGHGCCCFLAPCTAQQPCKGGGGQFGTTSFRWKPHPRLFPQRYSSCGTGHGLAPQ